MNRFRIFSRFVAALIIIAAGTPAHADTSGDAGTAQKEDTFQSDYDNTIAIHDSDVADEVKYAAWTELITKHPDEPHCLNVMQWVIQEKYHGDPPDHVGAIAFAEAHRGRISDPDLRSAADVALLEVYGKAGAGKDLKRELASLIENNKITPSTFSTVVGAATAAEEWEAVEQIGRNYAASVSPESLRAWWHDLERLSDSDLDSYVRKHRALALMHIGWSQSQRGTIDESLATFEKAAGIAPFTYHGTFYDLNLYWARALMEKGAYDEAMKRLVPDAFIQGSDGAAALFEEAYLAAGHPRGDLDRFAGELTARVTRRIDGFDAVDYDGRTHHWKDLKGAVTLITFWYPTCGDCKVELPLLDELYRKYRDRGLRIIALETLRDTDRATEFITSEELSFSMLENGEGDKDIARKMFGITEHPSTYLIDGAGRIISFHLGFHQGDEEVLEKEVRQLLPSTADDG